MWQLQARWQGPQAGKPEGDQEVRLHARRLRWVARWGVIVVIAAACAYFGRRTFAPYNWAMATSSAAGGAAIGLLLFVVPRQAWRLLRRAFFSVRLAFQRKWLDDLLLTQGTALSRRSSGGERTAELLNDLAVTEYLRGSSDKAEGDLARALELSPTNGATLTNLGVVLAAEGQHDRAAELFVQAMGNGSSEEASTDWCFVAPFLSSQETLGGMLAALKGRAAAPAFNNIGVAYARGGNWDLAREYFAQAAEKDPSLAAAHANLGLAAFHRGELQAAVDHLLRGERRAPHEAVFPNHLGVVFGAGGQPDTGRKYLQQAHRLDPADPGVRLNSLLMEGLDGHWQSAIRGLRAVAAEAPDRADAHTTWPLPSWLRGSRRRQRSAPRPPWKRAIGAPGPTRLSPSPCGKAAGKLRRCRTCARR